MLSLGLDPSLNNFGWAVYCNSDNKRCRLVKSGNESTVSNNVPVARLVHFRSMVDDLLHEFSIDVVGIESPAFNSGPFGTIHYSLMMYALEAVFNHRVDCVLLDPTTVKYLVGKSNFVKTDMQRFVQLDTLSPEILQEDQADAYCIAKFASRFAELQSGTITPDSLSENEQRVFLKRTKKVKNVAGTKVVKKTAYVFKENNRFYQFSKVPLGRIDLPKKSQISPVLLKWLENSEENKEKLI